MCTMGYYAIVRNNEIMQFDATWMELKYQMLMKSEQVQYWMIALICNL